MHRFIATSLLLSFSACASHIKEPTRAAITARHKGRVVALRQSSYFGDLYDENQLWLLSPHPFAQTSHIVDTTGAPIYPRGQRGIIPMGTTFVVQRVEFPDARAMAGRMLTTPRYNTWVYLSAVPDTPAPMDRKGLVLVLPLNLETEGEVEAAISELFTTPAKAQAWLAARRPTIRAAIEHKDIVEGMTEEELFASMGKPLRWFNDTTASGLLAEVAWYKTREAWLSDKVVLEARRGRPAPSPR